ncbi:MAG: ParB/RepB/Spo0J family partition protein [Phycisphaerales bacterium]
MNQLADSIREAGVIQPILVRAVGGPGSGYELVAGERRWRAARKAGMDRIAAIVISLSDEQAAEWALVENLQRTDLNTMERAHALRALQERFGLAQADIAQRVGLDRSTVANLIRLTELDAEIQDLITSGQLTAGHGKALLAISDTAQRLRTARKAAKEGWSVRKLEAHSRSSSEHARHVNTADVAPSLVDLERRLSEHLGTRVRILTRSGTRGRLSIEFYSLDHFDSLMHKLRFEADGL